MTIVINSFYLLNKKGEILRSCEWEVERIVQKRMIEGKNEYLVNWKGFDRFI